MLLKSSAITGYAVVAKDGKIGKVSDFLFDDSSWLIRWFVVDTGKWLAGRKVLLPPSMGAFDRERHELCVGLTMQQVTDSPTIDSDKPVSRQMETGIYEYYGWSPYWGTGFSMGGYGYVPPPIAALSPRDSMRREDDAADDGQCDGDRHLRSTGAVTGYHIHARDGEIGHVEDFLLEDTDWHIHYLVVDTKNWWPGKKVLISPQSAQDIDWGGRLVNLDLDRQKIQDSPPYDPSVPVDGAYEKQFHSHYAGAGVHA